MRILIYTVRLMKPSAGIIKKNRCISGELGGNCLPIRAQVEGPVDRGQPGRAGPRLCCELHRELLDSGGSGHRLWPTNGAIHP